MKRLDDTVAALMVVSFFCVMVCTMLNLFGFTAISYTGFGVDSQGRMYIGRGSKIEVRDTEHLLYTIQNHTSRGYAFSVKDDTIILSTGSTVVTMDLYGEDIGRQEDINSSMIRKLKQEKYNSIIINNAQYTVSNVLGFLQISKNGEPVYIMPVQDYLVKVLLLVGRPIFLITTFLYSFKHKRG